MNRKYLLTTLAASGLGAVLYGYPAGPDAPQSWVSIFGAFFITVGFAGYALGLGSALQRFLPKEQEAPVSLLLGLGLLAWLGQWVAHCGGLGYFPHATMLLVFFLAALLLAWAPRQIFPESAGRGAGIAAAFVCLFYFSLTWIPDSMPDPLWYNLTAARHWSNVGGYAGAPLNLAFLQSGAWDALLFWGNFLLGSMGEGGLIAGQFFGQWLHFGGGLLSLYFLWRLLAVLAPRLAAEERAWITIASALGISQSQTWALAKNDWGATALVFGGFFLWWQSRSRRELLVVGFLLGISFSTKASMAFAALLLGGLLFFSRRPKISDYAFVMGGAGIAAAPWLLRNFLAVGDPFFPALQAFFPARAGPSWEKFTFFYEGAAWSFNHKGYLAGEMLRDSMAVLGLIPALAAVAFQKVRRELYAEWKFVAGATAVGIFFLAKAGVKTEYRLFGGACLLWTAAVFALLFSALKIAVGSRVYFRWAGLILFTLSMAWLNYFSSFPWRAPAAALRQELPAQEIRSQFGGTVLAWIRLQLPANAQVASLNEHRLYYLSNRRAFRVWDQPDLDHALYQARNLREAIDALRHEGIDFLIFTRLDWDRLDRRELVDAFGAALLRHPQSVVFRNENSSLVDLGKLETNLASERP